MNTKLDKLEKKHDKLMRRFLSEEQASFTVARSNNLWDRLLDLERDIELEKIGFRIKTIN